MTVHPNTDTCVIFPCYFFAWACCSDPPLPHGPGSARFTSSSAPQAARCRLAAPTAFGHAAPSTPAPDAGCGGPAGGGASAAAPAISRVYAATYATIRACSHDRAGGGSCLSLVGRKRITQSAACRATALDLARVRWAFGSGASKPYLTRT
jgi:hypothetical protein